MTIETVMLSGRQGRNFSPALMMSCLAAPGVRGGRQGLPRRTRPPLITLGRPCQAHLHATEKAGEAARGSGEPSGRTMADLHDADTDEPSLSGKRAIITGGTTGIGRAIAILLASYGVRVFICGRTPEHLHDALERIREVGEGSGIALDLAEQGGVDRFFAAAHKYLGGLDIAVINAAVPADGLTEMDAQDLRYAIATDFTAYITSAHTACRLMGGNGHIVLIGSTSAHAPSPGSTVYAGMKAGIAAFSEALTKELGSKGVKVSLVEPGFTSADFHYPELPAEKQDELIREEKLLRAQDIAVGVRYLLTQPSRVVVQQLTIVPRLKA
ncbi:SDR family oxidoreductase [Niveispirillum fermenti]|uniref:SDR family oxidoreductase n=1 Tax=Niveispirillum fermenti TaxID=1233113 RepID=UPI003A88CBE1